MKQTLADLKLAAALSIFLLAVGIGPAAAQLAPIGPAYSLLTGGFDQSAETAYDPVHDVYLVTGTQNLGAGDEYSPSAIFVARDGRPIGLPFVLGRSGGTKSVRAAYSPDVSDGAGGRGGFLVVWNGGRGGSIVGQIVAYPGRLVGDSVPVFPGRAGTWVSVAYSWTDRVFMVGSSVCLGPDCDGDRMRVAVLDLSAAIARPILSLSTVACFFEFPYRCAHDLIWNPVSNEFGVFYPSTDGHRLARVRSDATLVGETTTQVSSSEAGGAAVNTDSGHYLLARGTALAEMDASGRLLAKGTAPFTLSPYRGAAVAYSPVSGTFLLAVADFSNGVWAAELNQHGVALGQPILIGFGFFPRIASHPTLPEWMTAVSTSTISRAFETSTRNGGSDAMLSDCITSDPFRALGGGTCRNSGWYPPGMLPPSSTPANGCVPPDPFVAQGGGTCRNGGWYPPTAQTPPAAFTPLPLGGCTTSDPFVALGGGTCYGGGWLPPGILPPNGPAPAGPAATPIVPGGCTTPDPFTFFGGGVCLNGGWRMRG